MPWLLSFQVVEQTILTWWHYSISNCYCNKSLNHVQSLVYSDISIDKYEVNTDIISNFHLDNECWWVGQLLGSTLTLRCSYPAGITARLDLTAESQKEGCCASADYQTLTFYDLCYTAWLHSLTKRLWLTMKRLSWHGGIIWQCWHKIDIGSKMIHYITSYNLVIYCIVFK